MGALQRFESHPGTKKLRARTDKEDVDLQPDWERLVNDLSSEFIAPLAALEIEKYKHKSLKKRILNRYYNYNLPYPYSDIRELLNNMPDVLDLPARIRPRFANMISENIRKMVMRREFEHGLRLLTPELDLEGKKK